MENRRIESKTAEEYAYAYFIDGLRGLSGVDRQRQDFNWCAAMLEKNPRAQDRIKGMLEFAICLERHDSDFAQRVVGKINGVQASIGIDEVGKERKWGSVVALVGEKTDKRGRRVFEGMATMENNKGQKTLVNVDIRLTDSLTFLQPEKKPSPNSPVKIKRR